MKLEHNKRFPVSFTIFCLFLYSILNGLGLWQLQRYHEKVAINKQYAENKEAAIVDLDYLLTTTAAKASINHDLRENGDISGMNSCFYRRILVEGQFLHDYEMHLYPRTYEVQPGVIKSGFYIITPFQTKSGGVILINRGWAPLEAADLNTEQAKRFYRPKKEMNLVVTIYPFPRKSWFSPPNDYAKNRWFNIDLSKVAGRLSMMTLMPIFAITEPYTPDGDDQWMPGKFDWPVVIHKPINLNNKHLEYAVTWYFFSLVLTLMFLYYVRKWHEKNQSVMMGFK